MDLCQRFDCNHSCFILHLCGRLLKQTLNSVLFRVAIDMAAPMKPLWGLTLGLMVSFTSMAGGSSLPILCGVLCQGKMRKGFASFPEWWPLILNLIMTTRELFLAGRVEHQSESSTRGGSEQHGWVLDYYKDPDVDASREIGLLTKCKIETGWSSRCVNLFYVILYCEWNWKGHSCNLLCNFS